MEQPIEPVIPLCSPKPISLSFDDHPIGAVLVDPEIGDYSSQELSAIPAMDFTAMNAIATCPTWGIVRYRKHLRFSESGRAMALEAGHVLHECFAVVRYVDTITNYMPDVPEKEFLQNALHQHMCSMFPGGRFDAICEQLSKYPDEDVIQRTRRAVYETIETSGFIDDPNDKIRTTTNIQESALVYIDQWEWGNRPILWIRSIGEPGTLIPGIEFPFRVMITIFDAEGSHRRFILTGRIDGLHFSKLDGFLPQENKTANRLNTAWEQSFDTSHQVTGYLLAASSLTGHVIQHGEVLGLAIPQPKSYGPQGCIVKYTTRGIWQFASWAQWAWWCLDIQNEFVNQPWNAPQFTNSCNRYFRPCAMIPFCSASIEERQEMLDDEMEIDEWDPLQ